MHQSLNAERCIPATELRTISDAFRLLRSGSGASIRSCSELLKLAPRTLSLIKASSFQKGIETTDLISDERSLLAEIFIENVTGVSLDGCIKILKGDLNALEAKCSLYKYTTLGISIILAHADHRLRTGEDLCSVLESLNIPAELFNELRCHKHLFPYAGKKPITKDGRISARLRYSARFADLSLAAFPPRES